MISANGGLPAHRYTPQVTPRWPRGSEPASENATPGSRACVPVRALLGGVGRAGLPGGYWCTSRSFGRLFLLLCWAPSGLGLPVVGFFFCSPSPLFPLRSCAPAVSGFLCFPALGALGLGALRLSPPPRPSSAFFFFLPFCAFWLPPPSPAPSLSFFSSSLSAPLSRRFLVSGPRCPGPRRVEAAHPPLPSLSPLCRFVVVFVSLSFAFPLLPCSRCSWCSWPLHRVAGFLFTPLCAALCVVCALCAGAVPPPAVPRVLLCGAVVCCGLFCVVRGVLRCCSVLCGVGVMLCGVLLCCVVGFGAGGLPWVLHPLFLWLPCCALLFCAVLCRVWCRRALLCGVLCCVLSWCPVSSGRRVQRVVWGFPALPSPPAAARCCRCVVPCRGPLLCSVLLVSCAACCAMCCCLCRFVQVVPCCFVRAG